MERLNIERLKIEKLKYILAYWNKFLNLPGDHIKEAARSGT